MYVCVNVGVRGGGGRGGRGGFERQENRGKENKNVFLIPLPKKPAFVIQVGSHSFAPRIIYNVHIPAVQFHPVWANSGQSLHS